MTLTTHTEKIAAVDPKTRALVYTSVSQLSRFDHSQYGGCQKKWWFHYVEGIKEEKTAQQEIGVKSHEQIEHYLKYNQDVLGPIVAVGQHLLPTPGTDLLVEWGLNNKPKPKKTKPDEVEFYPPEEALLHADGVPLIGFIDIVNPRGTFIGSDGILYQDPPNTMETADNKTGANLKNAKKGIDLIKTTQMTGYSEFLSVINPKLEWARTSHINFQTRGAKFATKETSIWPIETVKASWEKHGHQVVREMREIALVRSEADVPGNLESCDTYNKDCSYKQICSLYRSTNAASRLKLKLQSLTKESKTMSLLNKVRTVTGTPAAPPVAANGAGQTPWIPPPAPVAPRSLPIVDHLTARTATQGELYRFSNGFEAQFLSAVDQGGQVLYSFLPKGGGTPFPVGPDEAIVQLPVAAAPVAIPPPPPAPPLPPPVVIAAPPPPPAPVVAAPPPPPVRIVAPPPPPAPVVQRDAGAPPPPPALAVPAAPAAKRGPGRPKGSKGEDPLADLNEAIAAAQGVFATHFGGKGSPEQLLPIWQALLAR